MARGIARKPSRRAPKPFEGNDGSPEGCNLLVGLVLIGLYIYMEQA